MDAGLLYEVDVSWEMHEATYRLGASREAEAPLAPLPFLRL